MGKYNLHQQYFLTEETVNGRYAMYTLLQFCQKIIKAVQTKQTNYEFQKYFYAWFQVSISICVIQRISTYTKKKQYLFPAND